MTESLSHDVSAIQRMATVPSIFEVIHRVTGMGYAAIARVTAKRWIACAVRDEIALGIGPGAELDLHTTICDEIRGHGRSIVIENVAEDPIYRDHRTPKLYGFQSYLSVPILRGNGDLFGTLFALDPAPTRLANGLAVTTFNLFAQLISLQLDADVRAEEG